MGEGGPGQAAAGVVRQRAGGAQLVEHDRRSRPGRRPRPRGRGSWPRPAPWSGRPRRSARSRDRTRTDRGCTPPGRWARSPGPRGRPGASGLERSARMPPWIVGCRVFTRPPSISGAPVTVGHLGDGRCRPRPARPAVLPLATSSQPSSDQPRGQVDQAGLVVDRQQRPHRRALLRRPTPARPITSADGGRVQAPLHLFDALVQGGDGVAGQDRHLLLGQDRARRRSRAWRGARCSRSPSPRPPGRPRTACHPGKAGSRAGWVFRIRPGKASKSGRARTVPKPAMATRSTSWRVEDLDDAPREGVSGRSRRRSRRSPGGRRARRRRRPSAAISRPRHGRSATTTSDGHVLGRAWPRGWSPYPTRAPPTRTPVTLPAAPSPAPPCSRRGSFTISTMRSPASVGFSATWRPAAASAAILAWAVPWEPEMMAPAWPILRPGGAVTPAM